MTTLLVHLDEKVSGSAMVRAGALHGQGEGEEGREDLCTIFQVKEDLSGHAVSHESVSFFPLSPG